MASGLDLLHKAQSQIGIKESPAGSNRVKYSRWYGLIGPWCFPAGVKVLTPTGYKNIENLIQEDTVIDKNGDAQKVSNVSKHAVSELVKIRANGTLSTLSTKEHPFYAKTKLDNGHYNEPAFIEAGNLKKGDKVALINNDPMNKLSVNTDHYWVLVEEVTTIQESTTVYNLEVENTHTFIANGFVVHNCDMFVSWCANQIGASNVVGKYANCPYHVNYFKKKGWWLSAEAKPQPGDIIFFASEGKACHVGIVEQRNGSYSVTTIEGNTSVSSNDNGGAVMRRVRTYGNPRGSWGILGFARPNYSGANGKVAPSTTVQKSKNYLQLGDKGTAVKNLQQRLIKLGYSCGRCGADGDFGNGTKKAVIAFQKAQRLEVDGIAGVNTIARINKLIGAQTAKPPSKPATTKKPRYDAWVAALQKECNKQGYSRQTVDGDPGPNTLAGCPTVRKGARGNITRLLQRRLIAFGFACGRSGADGDFGPGTRNAVIAFQRAKGLSADGIVGKNTWRKLLGL